jgi:hypothetical protein
MEDNTDVELTLLRLELERLNRSTARQLHERSHVATLPFESGPASFSHWETRDPGRTASLRGARNETIDYSMHTRSLVAELTAALAGSYPPVALGMGQRERERGRA